MAAALPSVHQHFGGGLWLRQLLSLTRVRVSNITHELVFWALVVVMAFFACFNGHYAGSRQDETVYPLTYLMLSAVEGLALLILYVIATFYAGELVWREKDTRFAGIHDALPMRETTDWLSKFLALCFVELVLITVIGVCGVVMQTVAGFYRYEFLQYFKELYLIVFPSVLIFILLSFLVQTIVPNKFRAMRLWPASSWGKACSSGRGWRTACSIPRRRPAICTPT